MARSVWPVARENHPDYCDLFEMIAETVEVTLSPALTL
jgi:hypothetical protein